MDGQMDGQDRNIYAFSLGGGIINMGKYRF